MILFFLGFFLSSFRTNKGFFSRTDSPNTLAAALYNSISKDRTSPFVKLGPSVIGIRELYQHNLYNGNELGPLLLQAKGEIKLSETSSSNLPEKDSVTIKLEAPNAENVNESGNNDNDNQVKLNLNEEITNQDINHVVHDDTHSDEQKAHVDVSNLVENQEHVVVVELNENLALIAEDKKLLNQGKSIKQIKPVETKWKQKPYCKRRKPRTPESPSYSSPYVDA